MTWVLSIINLVALPFQKMCKKYHVVDVTICSMNDVHCNACHSKSNVHKSSFLQDSIATKDECTLLTIEGKWLEVVVHMIEFEFLNLTRPKQIQFLVSIHVYGKFQLSPTFALVSFQKHI
jgi:hypothetical protein